MEITIGKLLEGKSTVIKDKEYLATSEYVTPFLEIMSKFTKDFYCKVEMPKQLTITDKKQDITYNRVWLQAVMPTKCDIDGYAETFNLVYGLDIRQPVYKIFKAYKDRRSENLYCFDSRWLSVFELKPGEKFTNFEPIIINLLEMVDDSNLRFKKMNTEFFSSDIKEKHTKLGDLIEKSMLYEFYGKGGKVKLSPPTILKAFQNIYMNPSSKYYTKDVEECSLFKYADAILTLITDEQDIINPFEKGYLCLQLFDNGEICK